ncbi:hypothetical protein ABZX92_17270 [Lentzea sp. NPDC006480]|uniref:hypothetical protein n=1 Tax=Lentzea sp. NPDC006480 TaxID=3157176 RepID=UPI0033A00590
MLHRTATDRGSARQNERRTPLRQRSSRFAALAALAVVALAACSPAGAKSGDAQPASTTETTSATSSASSSSAAPSSSSVAPTTTTPKPAPPGTPKPPSNPGLTGWPSAGNTGVKNGGLRALKGDQLIDVRWLKDHGARGSGNAGDPFVFENYEVDGMVHINVPDATQVLVQQSRIYGGDNHAMWIENGTVTVQDSTIAPRTGGLSGNGIFAYDRGTFLRNNIWGFNIPIIIQGQGPYLIQDNFLHDIWFKAGDHTDVININPNGSNGVIKHNYIDGIRSDGQYTHNGIGIYNDATPGAGTAVSKNWTIDGNYITRSNHLIFAAASPPFVIKNNVLTTEFQYAPFHNALGGETDGGGNVDQNGKPVKIQG